MSTDVRFEITDLADAEGWVPDGPRYHAQLVRFDVVPAFGQARREEVVETYLTDDPYGDVAAFREVQAVPLEDRWDLYAERGW